MPRSTGVRSGPGQGDSALPARTASGPATPLAGPDPGPATASCLMVLFLTD